MNYLQKWRKYEYGNFVWASLENFWCVKGKYLTRRNNTDSSFNQVIGRPPNKEQASNNDSWLAGYRANPDQDRPPESKKVFSFKTPTKGGQRTFGFIKPDIIELSDIISKLNNVWKDRDWSLLTGEQIKKELFKDTET